MEKNCGIIGSSVSVKQFVVEYYTAGKRCWYRMARSVCSVACAVYQKILKKRVTFNRLSQ